MRYILLIVLLALTGCVAAPSPVTPAASTTPSPEAFASPLVAPGGSLIDTPWRWNDQRTPSEALSAAIIDADNPESFQAYLLANVAWRDDYDIAHFLSPNEVVEAGRTVCTGFARTWQAYLGSKFGIRAEFVAFYGPQSAHAVTVFRAPDGRFRLTSNQFYYKGLDLDPANEGRDAAIVRSAAEFYGAQWSSIEVYDEGGVIRQKLTNQALVPAPTAQAAGRNVFSVRR